MASPYSTPRYPGAPNPTPRSTQKALRPPIHNPYDKFTQPEFDAWIGDITGALKRALGREDAPPPAERATSHPADEEGVEDSFAEVKARRLAKGKERARDEDYEAEAEAHREEEDEDGWGEELDGEEYSSGESGESEEEAAPVRNGAVAEVIDLLSDDDEDAEGEDPMVDDNEESAEEDAESAEEEAEEAVVADYDEENETGSDDDEASPRSSPAAGPSHVAHSYAHEVTEIIDSDDEPEEVQEEEPHRAVPARFQRKPTTVLPEDFGDDDEVIHDDQEHQEEELDEEQAEEEDTFPPREKQTDPVDITDPWRGPATYAEDFYSGGDFPESAVGRGNPHALPTEEDQDEPLPLDSKQTLDLPTSAVDNDTQTLPNEEDADDLPVDEPVQTPDLPDPWDGPRNYAEDFYSGGDALPDPTEGATPSHLTPKDEGPVFIPGISSAPEQTAPATASAGLDIDDLYADVEEPATEPQTASESQAPAAQDEDAQASDEESVYERSPSPPSATLRTHVDWNWPPAFPGRVATRPGHIEGVEREVYEISDEDDEEDELAPSPGPAVEQSEPAPEQYVASVEAAEPQPAGAQDEDKEVLPETTNDAAALYGELADLYDMGSGGASFDTQASFEPISPPGMDFGDLPAFNRAFATLEEDIKALDAGEAPPALHISTDQAPRQQSEGGEAALGDLVNSAYVDDESPMATSQPRRYSVGLEEVTDEDEPDRPREPAAAEPEMIVVEVEDPDDDIRSSAPPEDGIDISSVRGSIEPSAVEYVVEEVMTEGRRTEEPEYVVWEEDDAPSHAEPSGAVHSASDEAPVSAPSPSAAPEGPHQADGTSKSERRTTPQAPAPALARTLSADFPPPISANPNVPDPASLSHTPRGASPASPEPARAESESESRSPAHDATALPANAALHPLFRKLVGETRTRSPSGLFTPLTDGHSASVTPEADASPKASGQGDPEQEQADADEGEGEDVGGETDLVEVEPEPVEAAELPAEVVERVEEAEEQTTEDVEAQVEPQVEDYDSIASSRAASPEVPLAKSAPQVEVEETKLQSADNHPANGVTAADFAADPRGETPGTDADAEGEVDPEYVSPVEEATPETPVPVLAGAAEDEEAQDRIDDDGAGTVELQAEPQDAKPDTENAASSPAEVVESEPVAQASTSLETAAEEMPFKDAEPASASSPAQESAADEAKDEVRPLKRKRGSAVPATRIPRLTRSRTSAAFKNAFMDHVEKTQAKSRATKGKGKGKAKAVAESDEEDRASVARSHSSESTSGGSSTAAQKMLVPDSRGTSRASSVASNAPSTYSALSQPSPTIDRVLPSNGHHLPPPPFIHNHGILHHHHGRPTAPVLPVIPKRQPSEPPTPTSAVARRASAEPGPSSQPTPSRAHAASSTSSPVTRSNCRFHTISVPKDDEDENSPRVHFAVPGCSLGGNAELMQDEEIEDQGFVKTDDIPRLIRDVESLNFSPYLVGILRQLVGVDLLREQEVFYIPRPDDGIVLKAKKKSHRAKLKQRESISARTLSNGGASRAKNTLSMAPPSQASVSTSGDSVSTAGKLSQRGSLATSASLSGSDLSDLEDEDARPAKRVKETRVNVEPESGAVEPPIDAAWVASEAPQAADTASVTSDVPPAAAAAEDTASTSTVTAKARKLQPRRSRRLGVDNLAYKPDKPDGEESDGSGEDEEADTKKKRKRGGKRGLKRTRTEENGEAPTEDAPDKPKRRRIRASTSNGNKPAAETEEAAS